MDIINPLNRSEDDPRKLTAHRMPHTRPFWSSTDDNVVIYSNRGNGQYEAQYRGRRGVLVNVGAFNSLVDAEEAANNAWENIWA